MALQIVMNHTGDSRHEFDPFDFIELEMAEARFNELVRSGFTAAARTGEGSSKLLQTFDPTIKETIFFPRLKGG